MKVIYSNQPRSINTGHNFALYEYDLDRDYDINAFRLELDTGRYPKFGSLLNEKSKQVIFVADGYGKIYINGEKFDLRRHDLVYLYKEDKYYFEDVSNLYLFLVYTPPWTESQEKFDPELQK
jgi:mannose-6-phosphate isomerase-like protein (cupin superfamily)